MPKFLRALAATLLLVLAPLPAFAADVTVFGAASLADALKEIAATYEKQSGKQVAVSLAASSALARQIEASGGADIFISADLDWMDYLDDKGLIQHATRANLLGNKLVLVAGKDVSTNINIAPHFDLLGALKGGRLAIADPDSVPAGKYGRTALTSLGVWNSVVNRLVNAENVRVALAYVARGEAPLGIVYETDAKADKNVRVAGVFPENTHPPILYPAALVKDAKPEARAFLAYLSSPAARAVFEKNGFTFLAK
ncbi:MAG: molybdate ABC transporter substrate-binding protein [Alphaproteobacteria bacterium]|nr:molybdate ABC transporter substrate-binding protein [Alphaproteobacteria bacterium]